MALPTLFLAQVLVSLAPTQANVYPSSVLAAEAPAAVVNQLAAPSMGIGLLVPDTVKRQRAIEYSNGYTVRGDIHRILAYTMLPLFLGEYVSGQEVLHKGSDAPSWARGVHKPFAYALAGVFTVNTVTGVWNLLEAKRDPAGKTRRTVHGIMMLVADLGFVYAGAIAPSLHDIDKRIANGQRGGATTHKRVALASIGVASVGSLMMYFWKD
jgi:hypothetical protein